MGIGGSLIYTTPTLNGLSGKIGFYTTKNPDFFRMDRDDIKYLKAGKDTLSRNSVKENNNYGLTTLAEAYIKYKINKKDIKIGRQIFNSYFTKANDTKMIPNSFDGISITDKSLNKTTLRLAYFTAQKLRDHSTSHDVLAFDSWNENDDGAVNKSLTADLIGKDNKLLIATFSTKQVPDFTINGSLASVPDVINIAEFEMKYQIALNNGVKIIPSLRVVKQFDKLDTDKNIANLKNKADGYNNPTSLDSNAKMAKIDIKDGAIKYRVGWSKIADKADMIAPWRGFVTGGYTRAMGQYNWYANTETFMMRIDYDFGKAGVVKDLKGLIRYAIQDFDDKKTGVQADSRVIHIDFIKKINKKIYIKFRTALVDMDNDIEDINGNIKADNSYNEYRLEINYLF